ncbi:hypothetical protein CORC01_07032 [Colletotrichum orchidophilum]|uniref:DUF7918 domain-containing protein n=1 Tax=Colletotrichum orchidophilum TaxID=1209926 RepID=A0A1G4B874_9PEZI|nr:uncharacterized protein CORC01_07032 [Colletotrichum orchidophilum]OHE97617.1 hypothetical protein CORC01_07032 [Colletotrichum orchidophilum]
MAGFDFHVYIRVVVRVAGFPALERDDLTAESLANEAPFSCSKVIEVKEGAKFSIHVLLGAGFPRLLAADDGLMMLLELDDTEVLRRLYTKNMIISQKSRQFRMEFFGILSQTERGKQVLQHFKFGTAKKDDKAIRGTIRIDLYIVKLLGSPERGLLNDISTSGPSVQTRNLGPGKKVKNVLAADTYNVKRLNYERPIGRFNFRYGPRGNLPLPKQKSNDENDCDEDLIDLSDVPALPKHGLNMFGGVNLMRNSSSLLPDLDNLSVVPAQTLTLMDTDPSSIHSALLDTEDGYDSELNRRFVPIRPKPPQSVVEEPHLQRDIPDDEAIPIQSFESKDIQTSRKRSAVAAFGYGSPSRPKKFLATSTY